MQRNDLSAQARKAHIALVVLGVWLVVAPFILAYGHKGATANELVVGILLAALAWVRLRSPVDAWATWTSGVLGLWLVFSPFIFGYVHPATYWNQLGVGILIVIAALASVGDSIRHHSHLAH